MPDKNLAQRQKEIMKLQDDMLLDIEAGVGRLHNKVSLFYRLSTTSLAETDWRHVRWNYRHW